MPYRIEHIARKSYPVFELEFGEAAAEYKDLVRFVLALLFESIPLLSINLPDGGFDVIQLSHPHDATRTCAAFGPLLMNEVVVRAIEALDITRVYTHLCCESAQWNTTVEICFVWSTSSCTCSSNDSDGELIAFLMLPPMKSSSRTSMTM